MRAMTPRGIISEAAIVVGVCAGMGMGVISRFDSERQDLARDLKSASTLMAEQTQIEQTHAAWKVQRERARAARESLRTLSEPASNAATLHERIMAMARSCDVRIDRIQPGQYALPTAAPASDDPLAPPPVQASAALANTIDAEGRYDSMVRFIEQLESLGLGRVNTVRISPLDNGMEHLVRASVSTVHFGFDPKQLAAIATAAKGATP